MSWAFFQRDDFACTCGCGQNLIEDKLIDLLEELRELVGFPLIITSGYRCPEHNAKVSSTGPTGPHTTGLAADIGVSRDRAVRVLEMALRMEFKGIGLNQKGDSRFVHLDIVRRETRTCWTY